MMELATNLGSAQLSKVKFATPHEYAMLLTYLVVTNETFETILREMRVSVLSKESFIALRLRRLLSCDTESLSTGVSRIL